MRFDKKKYLLIILPLAAIIAVISLTYYNTTKYDALIYPNVSIESVYVGELSKEDATLQIQNYVDTTLDKKLINIDIDGVSHNIPYRDLGVSYDIDTAVNDAYSYGKDLSFTNKFSTLRSKDDVIIDIPHTYDEDKLNSIIDELYAESYVESQNAKLTRSNGEFNIEAEVIGSELVKSKLQTDIINSINATSERMGKITASTKQSTPKITSDTLDDITTQIGSYSTAFTKSSSGRCHNIALSSSSVDGTILMPGDEFSFSEAVGSTSVANGYKEAKVIINNKLVPGTGGGVCQTATTLFNAVLRSGIEPSELNHHTLPPSYVPVGLDATLASSAGKDFKFVNTLDHPLYIEGYVKNKSLFFNIYSSEDLDKYSYDISSTVTEVINNKTIYNETTELKEGKKKTDVKGTKGYRVNVYKTTKENGEKIDSTLLYSHYYRPVDKVVNVGASKSNSNTNASNNTDTKNTLKTKDYVDSNNSTSTDNNINTTEN